MSTQTNPALYLPLDSNVVRDRLSPVHWHRVIELAPTTPAAMAGLAHIHEQLLPAARDLVVRFNLTYETHVLETCKDGDHEHVILPRLLSNSPYTQRMMRVAGFDIKPDPRQFATQDGLRDALLGGSNFNKRWD